jgi:hypothetical protein
MSATLPGYEAGFSSNPREVLYSQDAAITLPILLDGTLSVDGKSPTQTYDLRAGWLVGRVTATGRWTPCKRTQVNQAGATGTAFVVDNAAAFRVGDVISVGNDINKTISAVDYTTNTITVGGSAFTFADNEAVAAEDGSQTCRGILLDFVRLRNGDNSASAHRPATLLVSGLVRTSLVLGDLTAVRVDTAARLAGVRFSDEHGIT